MLSDEEVLTGDTAKIGDYNYEVTVYSIGRFNIHIWKDDQYGYYIAGDKKTKFDMEMLLAQIENIVLQHAPNNKRIREVIEKYWPVWKWRSKQLRNMKKDYSGLPD